MSLLTKNRPASLAEVRDRAMANAQRAMPAARDVSTAVRRSAEDAGIAVRRSAEDAAAWARPHVGEATEWARPRLDDARAWVAPRLERSGMLVQETIAPAIADAMMSAARAVEVPRRRQRPGWAKPAAITMMLAAIASAAAAVILRRRPPEPAFPAGGPDGPADPDALVDPAYGEEGSIGSDPEVNGRPLDA